VGVYGDIQVRTYDAFFYIMHQLALSFCRNEEHIASRLLFLVPPRAISAGSHLPERVCHWRSGSSIPCHTSNSVRAAQREETRLSDQMSIMGSITRHQCSHSAVLFGALLTTVVTMESHATTSSNSSDHEMRPNGHQLVGEQHGSPGAR